MPARSSQPSRLSLLSGAMGVWSAYVQVCHVYGQGTEGGTAQPNRREPLTHLQLTAIVGYQVEQPHSSTQ